MKAAIDFGITNTDIVAEIEGELSYWTRPASPQLDSHLVEAILASAGIKLASLQHLAVTGGRHQLLTSPISNCDVIGVGEVQAIGRGGKALIELSGETITDPTLVVSAGTGTAVVAVRGEQCTHITGTGVGGGTLLGLSRLLLRTVDPYEIDGLAQRGDPNRADLRLDEVVSGPIGQLPPDATAVNLGRLVSQTLPIGREDLASALVTLVCQVIGIIAINAAHAQRLEHIIVIGHLTDMISVHTAMERVNKCFGVQIAMPPNGGYATALGALRSAEGK